MKMTTKMLAVAFVAVMAFAAFAVAEQASDDDGATSATGDGSYTICIDPETKQFSSYGPGEINYTAGTYYITGTLKYDNDKDSWPLTVEIRNTLWYQQSLTYVLVDGMEYPLSQGSNYCYFYYGLEMDWNEAQNKKTITIKDNSPVTKDLKFDMTGVLLQKFKLSNVALESSNMYTSLDAVLADMNVGAYIEVLKVYKPSYNYGNAVEFGNGYKIASGTYKVEKVDSATLPGGTEVVSIESLSDVESNPVPYMYKATFGTNSYYIMQKWNLAPIAIESIKCSENVEYNGKVQTPSLIVTDVKGNTVAAENYTAEYCVTGTVTKVTPQNAASYTVTLKTEQNNFYAGNVSAEWKILPYDLSKGDRLMLVGADDLVYNGELQTVTIKFDKTTEDLYSMTSVNKFTISSATYKQLNKEGTDIVNGKNVQGSEAGIHTIDCIVNDTSSLTGAKNFTSGIEDQPMVTLTWTIAQKSIVGISAIEWVSGTILTSAILVGTEDNLIKATDYMISYVSNDGQRVADSLEKEPYGSWYAVAYGIANYSGFVKSETFVTFADPNHTVYSLGAVAKADQGKSMQVAISPAIAYNALKSAQLYINYTTVKVVDGAYKYTPEQKVVDITLPASSGRTVSSVYVTFDAIFTYADVTLKYGYGPSNVTEQNLIAYDYSNTVVFNPGSSAWSELSTLTIIDSYGNYIKNACLELDNVVYQNGAAIPSGLKAVSSMKVVYMDKYYDVSNYSIIDGKVLFDGKVFYVGDISKPTTKLTVSADKVKADVGEVIKLSVKDVVDANFSATPMLSAVSPSGVDSYINVDVDNWTVSASIACTFKVTFQFNGVSCEKEFGFGKSTAGYTVTNVTTDGCSSGVDRFNLRTISNNGISLIDEGANASGVYEGELVKITYRLLSGKVIDKITLLDDKGNEIVVSSMESTDVSGFMKLYFVMPASDVTINVTFA